MIDVILLHDLLLTHCLHALPPFVFTLEISALALGQ